MVERELRAVTSFMAARGLIHFDAHFENILTDGERLYVSDFGQALSARFTLAADERDFLAIHRDFDASYVLTALTNAVRDAPAGREIVERYGRIADVMNEFFANLRRSKTTPYPVAALSAANRAR
jgi:serine/threonine-protein kinase RIO1